ncbi:MAG: extracellular solute-binding protein [Solirubrobacteraceae bacterium]
MRSRRVISMLAVLGGVMALATPAATATRRHGSRHTGEVQVLSAGSLDTLLSRTVGPAFHHATGYTLVDTSGGSTALAAQIRNRVYVADVFISASPAVNATLEGARNGGWVSWYAAFAASPEVLAYYPRSRFAHDLRTMPWYQVITKPGFRLGRTNPSQDPGGVLAAKALVETSKARHLPTLARLASETSDEYSEDTEQAGVQNGQLDAAFMYEADANSQHSPFVGLSGVRLAGDYTVTMLRHAPHRAAAQAFIAYLLGARGRAAMRADHFQILSPPRLSGSGVPAGLRATLR